MTLIGKEKNSMDVFLVETECDDRRILKNMLIGQGFSVSDASSETDFNVAISNTQYRLIIVSSGMSIDAAAQICRKLRLIESCENIPILIICDNKDLMSCSLGLTGTFDYAKDPLSRDEVLARAKNLMKISELSLKLDVTRDRLLEAQKMECVGALAAGVAHEFNNLMCSVMGFAEMARAGGGTDIEALRESAEISYQAAKRASTTAASLLAFSRRAKSKKSYGSLNGAISSAVRLLKRNIEKSGVRLEVEAGDIPDTMLALGPIQQVFLNLIINAWHASDPEEKDSLIKIRTWSDHHSRIIAEVTDLGQGISKENMEHIFEPFFTTKNKDDDGDAGAGTGLGLMIVKEVITDHEGLVEVESKEGVGTCFKITLPVIDAKADGDDLTVSTEADGDDGDKYGILIIDDEEPARRMIVRMLTRRGHSAYSAANMSEAINLLWSHKIDLIVMDLVMPETSGRQNIQRLRSEGVDMPILICTGHANEATVERAMVAGANGVIRKPFAAAEFIAEMKKCMPAVDSAPSSSG